jgi:D-alanyl-D-alanine carboxypeptidase (penicillin-binding protein 5/6)
MVLCAAYMSQAICAANIAPEEPTDKPIVLAPTTPLPNLGVTGYSLINQSSNTQLAALNADERMPPASLTKLMTLFIAYDYLDKGLIRMEEPVFISKKAWQTEGSRMFLEPETEVPVWQLLKGISVVSGNDASVAIAEHIAGTEDKFAVLMNQKAEKLGLQNTQFMNSTGLPNTHHYSTPYDMSIIGAQLIKQHPDVLKNTRVKSMKYNNITQDNRNRLLWKDDTMFGLKTGHTKNAGYCLVAAAERDSQIMIATVFGAKSERARDAAVTKLINHAQNRFKNITIAHDNKLPAVRVWYGQDSHLSPQLKEPIHLSIPDRQHGKLHTRFQLTQSLKAPIHTSQVIGSYTVYINDSKIIEKPLIANRTITTQPIWQQPFEWLQYQIDYLSKHFIAQ